MKFDVTFKALAETKDKNLLENSDCRRVNRWYCGVYLTPKSKPEVWGIPDSVKQEELYIEATYPVRDDYVVTILDSYGNRIKPMVSRDVVSGLTFESIVSRGSMMVFVMDIKNRETTIRKINIVEKNGRAILIRRRLFQNKVLLSEDRFQPSSVGLPRDNFLNMFWWVLVDACNKANVDNLLLKPGVAHENGKKKVVLSAGVIMSSGHG
jgi:hypothetical protein